VDEEAWKKYEELIMRKPELKTNREILWREQGAGENFRSFSELLKANAIPTITLSLLVMRRGKNEVFEISNNGYQTMKE